jgi:hypothetical protein
MAKTPELSRESNVARGVFLTVDDIERITKAFQVAIAEPGRGGGADISPRSCGVIVCGNGAQAV